MIRAPRAAGSGVALLPVVLLLSAPPAWAAATGPVRLAVDPCVGVDVDLDELTRLVELEAGLAGDDHAVRVTVGCADAGLTLDVFDPDGGRRATRPLRIDDTPREARARLLTLVALEAAAAVLARVPSAPPPPAPPPQSAVEVQATAAPPAPVPVARWALLATAGGSRFASVGQTAGLAGLRLRREGRRFDFALDAEGSLGNTTRQGRDVQAASLSLSPLAGAHARWGRVTLYAATGPRLAVGRLGAAAALPGDQSGTFTAPWVGWLGQVEAGLALGGPWLVELTGEAGYVIDPIAGRIAGQRAVALEGGWAAALLSLGAYLPD